jgi:hypothetical protein
MRPKPTKGCRASEEEEDNVILRCFRETIFAVEKAISITYLSVCL